MEKENYEGFKTGTPENKNLNRQPDEAVRKAVDAMSPVSSVSGAPSTEHIADNFGGHPAAVDGEDSVSGVEGVSPND